MEQIPTMRAHIDIINEAIARKGDWAYNPNIVAAITKFVFDKSWEIQGKITIEGAEYIVARHESMPTFVVGEFQPLRGPTKDNSHVGKTEFAVICRLDMSKVSNISFRDKGLALGFPNLHVVNGVAIKPNMQGYGIAKALYILLVDQGIEILGDREQYFGARRLWASLSKELDVIVDIVDFEAETLIDENVTLHHGQYDHDFDQRVWSYGEDKASIRLVLRKIIDIAA